MHARRLVILFTLLTAACGGNPEGPTATAAPPTMQVVVETESSSSPASSARGTTASTSTTASVLDKPNVNGCDTTGFRIHQTWREDGTPITWFEMPPGEGNPGPYDTRYHRRTNPTGGPDVWPATWTPGASLPVPIVDNIVTAGGHYEGQMKARLCASWSTPKEFTIPPWPSDASVDPPPPVEPPEPPTCQGYLTPNGCVPNPPSYPPADAVEPLAEVAG